MLFRSLFVEKDADKRKQHVLKIQESLDNFIDGYPDDGGCDEGAHYWDRAAGSLCDNLWLLNKATSGNIDLSNNRKIKEMGAFLCKMNIGNGFGVNFADTNNKLSLYIIVV